jgi:hypothetical protein
MLIFDPKSGQSVTVDLAAKRQRPADVPHVHAATKVPARASNISAFQVTFDLQSAYTNTRHSWSSSNEEYNKNKIALLIHGDCLHHPWSRAWSCPTPQP